MHFGIREHAMAAVLNGMALAKLRPFGSTFFTFSDYLRPAIRLAAIIELPVIHVYTHDSIGVGEDGPTHQRSSTWRRCGRSRASSRSGPATRTRSSRRGR